MTIISASYKTDIPAFYGEWFDLRLKDGKVSVRNPFSNKMSTLSLKPEDVDGIVLWTRNIGPFLPSLNKRIAPHFPFYIQYTVTGYPRLLESSVPDAEMAIMQIRALAQDYGPKVVVWRYDPILISSVTPIEFHLANFKKLSNALHGYTDEVVVSFTQFYQKTRRNLASVTHRTGIIFEDPEAETKRDLLQRLSKIAELNGQRLTLCTQPGLEEVGLNGAECISAARLGLTMKLKVQGNRPGCLCVQSKDIGGYDTCPHGCAYCYAVGNKEKAKVAYKNHGNSMESLP